MNWWTVANATFPLIPIQEGDAAPKPLKIAAKLLSEMSLPSYCPACWWMKYHLGNKFPYQIPPALLTMMDSVEKRLCHSWFDRQGGPPPWLKWGDLTGYLRVGRDFNYVSQGVLVRGVTDDIFTHAKGLKIIDYKTSKFKGAKDMFFQQYVHQLNFYALIAEEKGLGRVTDLALGYVSLNVSQDDIDNDDHQSERGMSIPFDFRLLPVPFVPRSVLAGFIKEGKRLCELKKRPAYTAGCSNCERVAAMYDLLSSTRPAPDHPKATTIGG